MVSQDATVRMIDCDSFQITTGSRRWFCGVGVGTHQPPEMQGLDTFDGIVRTPNQDAFGLAVIVFQLLCMARHPFSGVHSGSGEAPSIEDAIKASRYAYSRDQARVRLAPPHGTLPMDAVGDGVRAMFELAFSPTTTRGGRPTAGHWVSALGKLGGDLRQCRLEKGHWHLGTAKGCSWCDVEAKTGFALFPAVFVGDKTATSGIALLWQHVSAIPDPGPTPPIPSPPAVTASPEAKALGWRKRKRRLAAVAITFVGLALIFAVLGPSLRPLPLLAIAVIALVTLFWSNATAARPYRAAAASARKDWRQLQDVWVAQPRGPTFSEVRSALETSKRRYDELPNERARRLQRLWEVRQQSQLAEHLDRYGIDKARIPGIGKATVSKLQAYQIYTAGDIDPVRIHIMQMPGFGPATKGKLVDWRRACERQFRFDASRGVAPVDLAALEHDIATKATKIEREIRDGLTQLRTIVADVDRRRRALEERAAEVLPRLAQTDADVRAIGG